MKQHGGSSEMEGNGEEMIWHGDGGSTPATANIIGKEKEELLVPQLRFPTGFHFLPTDEELLDVYLRGKIDGRKPPLDVFMDVKILDWDPAKLVEERKAYGEGRYFFFTQRTEWPSGRNGESRRQLNGVKASWKATGHLGIIRRSGTGETIGTRRILSYESSGVPRDKWSMNEYVLAGRTGINQWVLCTIQEKLHWKTKSSKGKTTADTSSDGKKCRRGSGTRMKHKMTKRQKKEKTGPSQPHKTEQQQQETTPDISSNPPPLLTSDHLALHEPEIMMLDRTTPMIQDVVPQEHPYEAQHCNHLDARVPQETAYEGPGEPPLMPHHQQGYQIWLEEQDYLEFEGISLTSILAHRQFDDVHTQCRLEPFNTMSLHVHHNQESMSHDQESMPRFFPPASGIKHAGEYQLPLQHTIDPLGTPEFHRDFIPTSQHELQFSQNPTKPSEQQTSPDDVLTCQHDQQWWSGKHTDKICFLCGSGGSKSRME